MKNKIVIVLAFLIVVGMIIVATVGFNVDARYKKYNLVEVKIGQEFNIKDIKAITKDVFPKANVEIQKAGSFNDYALIKVKNINDEQKNSLNTKINEKYGINNSVDDIKVNIIPKLRVRDMVKPYIVPVLIVSVLILIYMGIRFRKIGAKKVLLQTVLLTVIAELLYFTIIAITRYPVNSLVMPISLVIYIIIITVLTGMFEKQKSLLEKE